MPANPREFAQRVLQAFVDAGNSTDAQVIRANGPSTSTMTKLRKVAAGEDTMTEPREPTWSKIDSAAAWSPGSARLVWRGLEPKTVGGDAQDASGGQGGYVEAPGARVEAGITNEDLLREIMRSRAELDQLRAGLNELGSQVSALRQDHDGLSRRVADRD